jgi:hypothetical protein
MKQFLFLSCLLVCVCCGCSEQLNKDRFFSGTILPGGVGDYKDGVYITAFQSNGKEGDRLRLETDDATVEGTGVLNYRLSIQPFQNEEATDITLSAKALYLIAVSTGLNRMLYNVGDVVISKDQVLDQAANEDLINDIVARNFGSVSVKFLTNNQNTNNWNAVISVSGEEVAHELEIQGSDFDRDNLIFPVQATGEVIVTVVGQKGTQAFSFEKRVSLPGFGSNNTNAVFDL